MALPLKDMLTLIREQKMTYQAILDLSRQKHQVLIGSDETSLDIIVQAEEKLLLYVNSLEKKRFDIAEVVAEQQGITVDELTISSWADIDVEQRRELEDLQSEFMTILTEIDTINQVNSKLLKVQLDYLHEMMNQVTSISESTSYDAEGGGKSRKTQENNLIDAIL